MEYADGGDLQHKITEQLKKGENFNHFEMMQIIA